MVLSSTSPKNVDATTAVVSCSCWNGNPQATDKLQSSFNLCEKAPTYLNKTEIDITSEMTVIVRRKLPEVQKVSMTMHHVFHYHLMKI